MKCQEPCRLRPWNRLLGCCSALVLFGSLAVSSTAMAAVGDLILNEYNCVSSGRYLGGGDYRDHADPDNDDLREDAYFRQVLDLGDDGLENGSNDGRFEGNGGNWMELVVIGDHLDIRDWELRWAETDADQTDGTASWYPEPAALDTTIEQGIIAFSDDALWADLRSGTIITISERAAIPIDFDWDGGLDDRNFTNNLADGEADWEIPLQTDTRYNPTNGDGADWWIHVSTQGEQAGANPLVTAVTNVDGNLPGDFSVGPDDWQLSVYDGPGADATLVFGPIGEDIIDFGNFPGGIDNEEVARLEADPTRNVTNTEFDDATRISTFGQPNQYGTFVQDFEGLYPTIVTMTSNTPLGYGFWNDASIWISEPEQTPPTAPAADHDTVVVGNVYVNSADAVASTLTIAGDSAAAVVLKDGVLTVGRKVEVNNYSLGFQPGGKLNITGGDLIMKSGTQFSFTLDPETEKMVDAAGNVELYPNTALAMDCSALAGPLGDLSAGEWGDMDLTIIAAGGQVAGAFAITPPVGHLGYGVFCEGVSYPGNAVVVELFQAATGDIDADRFVDFNDVWGMLTSGKYNTGDPAVWTDGEFTLDGIVDFNDVWALLTGSLYNQGDYTDPPSTTVVPEPGTVVMLLSAALLMLPALRRRRKWNA